MDKFKKLIGNRIKELRTVAGLTQEKLAEKVNLATETISRLERGFQLPAVETLQKVAKAIGVDLATVFDFPNNKKEKLTRPYLDKVKVLFANRSKDQLELAVDVVERLFRDMEKSGK